MGNKSMLSLITDKIVDTSNNKSGFLGSLAKLITNPINPEKIVSIAKDTLVAGINCIQRNNEELKKFEKDAAQTHREVDDLEQMVHTNWQQIKKCNSDAEYLQEEERIAKMLEEKMRQQPQSQQQKHIGS